MPEHLNFRRRTCVKYLHTSRLLCFYIDDHWFQDLKHQIEDEHTTITLIPFPDSEHPDVDAWQKVLDQQIPKVDEDTYFVAHSLGVITLLHFLQNMIIKILEE